jgi:hypothetical protein
MEGSLVAYKVFTNGSVLQASELNENLMQQSTAVFSNAAARTAAITSPVEGQLTYLEDVNRYDHWNGSAWVSPFGMTLLNSTSFTAASTISVNNVFSSDYFDYKIMFSVTDRTSTPDVNFRLRNGGVDTSVNYSRTGILTVFNSTTITVTNQVGTTSGLLFPLAVREFSADITVSNPAVASETILTYQAAGLTNSVIGHVSAFIQQDNASAFDGFTIFTSTGTITGNLRVYGLRK